MISPISKLFKLTADQVAQHEARIMKDALEEMKTQVRVSPAVEKKVADKNTGQFVFEDYFNVEPYIKASTGRLDPLLDTAVNNPANIEKEILNAMRTGRIDGKKLSSQQRRNISFATQQATDEMEAMLDLDPAVIWNSSPTEHMIRHIPADATEEFYKNLALNNMIFGKDPLERQIMLHRNREQARRLAALREEVGLPSMNVDFEGMDLAEQAQVLDDKLKSYLVLRQTLDAINSIELPDFLKKFTTERENQILSTQRQIYNTWKESGASDFKGDIPELLALWKIRKQLGDM